MWTPRIVPSWEAFNAAVVDFDAEQAQRHRTRRFPAAAVVCAMPEAVVCHLVPHECRFGLSAFACSAWPRSSPLVLNTPTPTPSETPSLACAWVLTAESLHPALGRIPCCKKHKSTQAWRTQVVAEGDTASELVSLRVHASATCVACTAVATEHAVASLRTALVM